MALKIDQNWLSECPAMEGGERANPLTEKALQEQEDLHAELVKTVTKEAGMDTCPVCESKNVVNNLELQHSDIHGMAKSYIVHHICQDCKKGYKVTITIEQNQIVKASLATNNAEQYTMYILYLVLQQARSQIEAFCKHRSETEPVKEIEHV